VIPFKATISVDVIGRQLIRAGQFYEGPARVVLRNGGLEPDLSVTTQVESRHGSVNSLLGIIGGKLGFRRRWVINGTLLFPLNSQGLQPNLTWVVGLERAFTR
jgi:hypothetical protein